MEAKKDEFSSDDDLPELEDMSDVIKTIKKPSPAPLSNQISLIS